ncbi:MAG: hypothetical protein WBV27_05055 [Trichococcus sp.]|uniref:hypothetical protein n=1 Tax=Trichococcus sp. TaxID=1985464 RepID=UPI003C40A9EF
MAFADLELVSILEHVFHHVCIIRFVIGFIIVEVEAMLEFFIVGIVAVIQPYSPPV